MSDYIFFLTGGLVSWIFKYQQVIATSSTEAEYIDQYNAAQESVWLRFLLEELDCRQLIQESLKLFADNNSAQQLFKNPAIHSQVKHMNIKYHWQQQEIEQGSIQIDFISSAENTADGLTKSFLEQPFLTFWSQIHMDATPTKWL